MRIDFGGGESRLISGSSVRSGKAEISNLSSVMTIADGMTTGAHSKLKWDIEWEVVKSGA